jgi:hypothetical protein
MRIHRDVEPHTKEEAEVAFAQGTREQIRDALLGVAYYEKDWRWVQSACLAFLNGSDTYLQGLAITCLGHLAMFHKTLDLAIVLPALQAHASDPQLAPALYDAFGDIASQVEDTSYFVEKWDELPQRIKKVLIGEGIFDRGGKRIKKRNFVPIRKSETLGQVSRDQELVERLKQQCTASSSYDWKEYYDEQGRLLRLNLADLGLVQLPAELWQFTSLQELDLGENPLSSLPTELGQLINLEWLGLDQNQLSSLLAELGQLVNLQELFLGENQLSSLPAELGQLANLQVLDLSQNQLSSLPGELGQLVNLRWLGLHQNQLNSLPVELGQLINLQTLFLRKNHLSTLPAELGQLINLEWLGLDENQLSSLPAELSQLANLEWLGLSQNPQLQIPSPEVVQQGIPAVLAYLHALP